MKLDLNRAQKNEKDLQDELEPIKAKLTKFELNPSTALNYLTMQQRSRGTTQIQTKSGLVTWDSSWKVSESVKDPV